MIVAIAGHGKVQQWSATLYRRPCGTKNLVARAFEGQPLRPRAGLVMNFCLYLWSDLLWSRAPGMRASPADLIPATGAVTADIAVSG